VLNVPDNKFYEFRDKLKIIVKALEWQNKSN
jgi:hypothetical protein